ncbi:MAG: type II secretion system protein [Phycisphaeraceae bacterium]
MRRSAFTLVEMLLVVSIIMVLIALLLPALQKSRGQARVASCKSQLHQIHTAIYEYQLRYRMRHPWQFANGSGDYPHEAGNTATRPGSPARALHLLTKILGDGKLFFCPDVPIDYEQYYNPTPSGDYKKFHGTYAYHYRHVRSADDPTPSGNGIIWANAKSKDLIMLDNSNNTWSSWGFPYQFEHYNALMLDGRVDLISSDANFIVEWLWGPEKKPYP